MKLASPPRDEIAMGGIQKQLVAKSQVILMRVLFGGSARVV